MPQMRSDEQEFPGTSRLGEIFGALDLDNRSGMRPPQGPCDMRKLREHPAEMPPNPPLKCRGFFRPQLGKGDCHVSRHGPHMLLRKARAQQCGYGAAHEGSRTSR